MPVKVFQPSEHKEEALQLFREGKTIEELVEYYGKQLSERTLYRYFKEVQDEKAGITHEGTKPAMLKAQVSGVVKEPFTPIGAEIPAPPGSSPAKQFVRVGNINMPLDNFGYSDPESFYINLSTFNQARKEYGFPPEMKMGDFTALLCQVFRMMRGWDVIGAGYNKEKEAITQ